MVDRQQRGEWRYRQGPEADGRTGREYSTRQGGGRGGGRRRHHRQLQGLAHVPEKWELVFRMEHTQPKRSPMNIQTQRASAHQPWEQVRPQFPFNRLNRHKIEVKLILSTTLDR